MTFRYDNFLLLLLSVALPLGFVQYIGLSTYIIPLLLLLLTASLCPDWAYYQFTRHYFFVWISIILITLSIAVVSYSYVSIDKLIQFSLISLMLLQLHNIPKSSIENFLSFFYKYNLFLIFIAFQFYLLFLLFGESFYILFITGYRFSSFTFENAELTTIIVFLIVVSLQRGKSPFDKYVIPFFLILCFVATRSNMIMIFTAALFYILLFSSFHRYLATLISICIVVFLLNIDITIFAEYLPSVRGGVRDLSARLIGTAQLISQLKEYSLLDLLKIEYFAETRTCIAFSEENNFGMINFFCDFRIYSVFAILFLFISLNRIICSAFIPLDKKFLLASLFFSWLFLPSYTTPTLILLFFALEALYRKELVSN